MSSWNDGGLACLMKPAEGFRSRPDDLLPVGHKMEKEHCHRKCIGEEKVILTSLLYFISTPYFQK